MIFGSVTWEYTLENYLIQAETIKTTFSIANEQKMGMISGGMTE